MSNNKGDIWPYSYDDPHMILQQVSMFKFDTCKNSQAMISYKLFSHSEPLGPMIREIYGVICMMTPLQQVSMFKFDTCKNSQAMISSKLFSHSEPLEPMIREILDLFHMMTPYLTLMT